MLERLDLENLVAEGDLHALAAARGERDHLVERRACPTDRRGIYTEVTQAGRDLLDQAQPTHDAVLTAALDKAGELPELAPLVDALAKLALPTKV